MPTMGKTQKSTHNGWSPNPVVLSVICVGGLPGSQWEVARPRVGVTTCQGLPVLGQGLAAACCVCTLISGFKGANHNGQVTPVAQSRAPEPPPLGSQGRDPSPQGTYRVN